MILDVFDIGETVLCDDCDADYTESERQGGMIFCGSAYCPDCAAEMRGLARANGEQDEVIECPSGVSFADFVRQSRQTSKVIIETLD